MSEKEFILRVRGYVSGLEDLRKIAVGRGPGGTPVLLGDVADIQLGPDMRRGIAELNGEGETVGGIVVVRYGADTRQVVRAVRARLDAAMKSLPRDVAYTVVYDRTALIDRAVGNLEGKLLEESLVIALVCALFLMRLRSALVAIVILAAAVLASFLVMYGQGISSNIMSLGGIAIAAGAMVDAAIIMIENAHKRLEREPGRGSRWDIIRDASVEVGPTLFYSLLVITVSFLPVFALQEEEGRLFKPLAFTKTYSMAAAAILSVTLAPVLMGYLLRGRIPAEEANPINRIMIRLYRPALDLAIRFRWTVVIAAGLAVAWVFLPWNAWVVDRLPAGAAKEAAARLGAAFPYQNLGSEFMPRLDEGDLLYMPTTFPGLSPTKAREILQETDRIIRGFPEVQSVFGKIGRAESATDPAPMDMVETTIRLRPAAEWPAVDLRGSDGRVLAHRPRSVDELVDALNGALRLPGLSNAWTMPIKARIDMLSTGIKTPVGIKVARVPSLRRAGAHRLRQIEGRIRLRARNGQRFCRTRDRGQLRRIRHRSGRDRALRPDDRRGPADVLQVALGGMPLTTTVEGLERYGRNPPL
jgi:copper/silver efflux system protein